MTRLSRPLEPLSRPDSSVKGAEEPVEAAFALLLGPGAIAVALLEAALGGLLAWRKSLAAAVALLVVALAAAGFVLLGLLSHEGMARAPAFVLALAGVWAGARAVHCSVAARRLASTAGATEEARS